MVSLAIGASYVASGAVEVRSFRSLPVEYARCGAVHIAAAATFIVCMYLSPLHEPADLSTFLHTSARLCMLLA